MCITVNVSHENNQLMCYTTAPVQHIQAFCMRRGISGLRVGWLHTLNADLIGAMDSLAYFAMPSTIIQEAATQMLLDKAFVKSYLKENQRRLARSYDALIGMHVVQRRDNASSA